MGCAPMAYLLWAECMQYSGSSPKWMARDRFVLSNGHACALQYTMLHLTGYNLSKGDLANFRQLGSKCPGHPESFLTEGERIRGLCIVLYCTLLYFIALFCVVLLSFLLWFILIFNFFNFLISHPSSSSSSSSSLFRRRGLYWPLGTRYFQCRWIGHGRNPSRRYLQHPRLQNL